MKQQGFTLIELAIVITIIGLLIGAIVAGRVLLRNAEVKATISQVEKYRSAIAAFDEKYNALPGDLSAASATSFGFTARAGTAGQGDGNGLIDGVGAVGNVYQGGGETGLFWVDLTSANGQYINLIDGNFSSATSSSMPSVGLTNLNLYMPAAQLGRANYFYVYEYQNTNYLGLSAVTGLQNGVMTSVPTLPIWEAAQIDQKMDDGYPQTGIVIAQYVYLNGVYWAAGGGGYGSGNAGGYGSGQTAPSNTTCYDNNTTDGQLQSYSMSSGAGNQNCALSFAF